MLNRLSMLCLWALGRLLHGCSKQQQGTQASPSLDDSDDIDLLSFEGPSIEEALNRLLTPHICRKLEALGEMEPFTPSADLQPLLRGGILDPTTEGGQKLRRLAKLLTTNSATPCLIWDNSCRSELTAYMDKQVEMIVKRVSRLVCRTICSDFRRR